MKWTYRVLPLLLAALMVLCARAQTWVVPELTLVSFRAATIPGACQLAWETEEEKGVEFFRLERLSGDTWMSITASLISAEGYEHNRVRYDVSDPLGRAGATYRLFAIGGDGGEALLGTVTYAGDPAAKSLPVPMTVAPATVAVTPLPASAAQLALEAATVKRLSTPTLQPFSGGSQPQRMYIGVRADGVYHVSAAQIAAVMNVATAEVQAAVAATNLALRWMDEADVAWSPATNDDGVLFYGRRSDSIYTFENPYWLSLGPGLRMAETNHTADTNLLVWTDATNRFFYSTARIRKVATCTATATHFSGADEHTRSYMAIGRVLNGVSRTEAFVLPDYVAGATSATLRISIYSLNQEFDPDEHSVRFILGSEILGTNNWSNEDRRLVEYNVPAEISLAAAGSVTCVNLIPAPPLGGYNYAGRFAWDWFEFDYPRRYRAVTNELLCSVHTNASIVVAGFTNSMVEAWDLGDPLNPIRRHDLPVQAQAGGLWSAGFLPDNTNRQLVLVPQAYRTAATLRAGYASGLASATNAADWVAIVPPRNVLDLHWAAQELAAFRSAQGLSCRVIAVEEIYDEFRDGLADARGIKDFFLATRDWATRPRYALLLGNGSADYRYENTANDPSLLPPLLTHIVFPNENDPDYSVHEASAADVNFVDDDSNGVPEIAIGRLAVSTSNQCAVVLAKMRRYEQAQGFKTNVLCAADLPTYNVPAGINLHTSVNTSAAFASNANMRVIKHYRYTVGSDDLKGPIAETLQDGAGLFYYLGHGGATTMGGSGNPDLSGAVMNAGKVLGAYVMKDGGIQMWPWQPVGISMSCVNNQFYLPSTIGSDGYCMGQRAMHWPDTGFAALYASAAPMDPTDATSTGEKFFELLYDSSRPLRLGDLIRQTMQAVRDGGMVKPLHLPTQTLLGDPATVVRHDITSWGTDTAWLAGYGLTNANDDVADQDEDSYKTWQEYPGATDPTDLLDAPLLRIASIAVATGMVTELGFESVPGLSYHVSAAETLPAEGWTAQPFAWPGETEWQSAETPIVATGTVTTVWLPCDGVQTQRFYRVELAP
ncbi:MAG: C25 family cysteine peptidase [Kiritimatiellae bacterium]|nr:C25 family cysteine peptidase [Kiritimatiellia bacterium]